MQRVLLADDNRDFYETCAPTRGPGDQFVTARTVEYALYMLEHGGRWDVLVLDYGFGEAKNGGHVLDWLAAHREHLPGHILVASTNPRGRKTLIDAIPKLYAGEPMGDVTNARRGEAGDAQAGRLVRPQADATGDHDWAYAEADAALGITLGIK